VPILLVIMPSCDAFGVAVEVALPHVLDLCDGLSLCAVLGVSSYWRRTFCCVNAPGQKLFQAACVQQWPWLQTSLSWSNSTHHLWQHYLGSWQALCCDKNRANSIYSFELDVPCNVAVPCIQSAWVNIPERELQVRVNVYPKGNRRMTTSHLSVYLEVQALSQKKEWHAALDFTFNVHNPAHSPGTVSWSSGPVRFCSNTFGGSRLDWGCHELLPSHEMGLGSQSEAATSKIEAVVSVQEALLEVVHMDWLSSHVNDFGLYPFSTFKKQKTHNKCAKAPIRLQLPSSITKAGLLAAVSDALNMPVTHLWRFSRSVEVQGRLMCNLPQAPRQMLAIHPDEDDNSAVYALLTKWTLGESAGGSRQNFFRILAETNTRCMGSAVPRSGNATRVYIKRYESDLRFEFPMIIPVDKEHAALESMVVAAIDPAGLSKHKDWCLIREGSPSDWSADRNGHHLYNKVNHENMGDQNARLINFRGPLVNGDILVLCPASLLPQLIALYQQQYERHVLQFIALYEKEIHQAGSTTFASLCQVMDSLNVDCWRLEQIASAAQTSRPLLCLMRTLPGLHPQFFCDVCGSRELRGCRFNCSVCSDFDLCEACYAKQPEFFSPKDHTGRAHEPTHKMSMILPPLPEGCMSRASTFCGLLAV